MYWLAVIGITCIKLLLKPAYHSTDFEVHRNWLAITHSLPIEKWYIEDTSKWTLDYPPLFAWFEWLLSQVAFYFDPMMLEVKNLNYKSEMTIVFQRISVIVTDLVFAIGCKMCCDHVGQRSSRLKNSLALFIILFGNAGLFIVDQIHFQYNGFLYGILFISIARMLQGREIESAFWFALLLNLKHIYLYIAPAYFIYLLRSYCFSSTPEGKIRWMSLSPIRLGKLAIVVVVVFTASFGPFIAKKQLFQVLGRLFPFKRGLSHAYWAPNFWALYNFADKILSISGTKLGIFESGLNSSSMTGGLVQEFDHSVLPSVPPIYTFIASIISMIPCLLNLWFHPHDCYQFIRSIVLCGFGSFMFGWHVHEKAALLIILPMGLLCMIKKNEGNVFIMSSIVSHFSLFPLIFTQHETPIKVTALLLHGALVCCILKFYWSEKSSRFNIPLCNTIESIYLYGLGFVFLYQEIIHKWLGLQEKFPFLPLMLISVYCAIGITYCWINYYRIYFENNFKVKKI